MATRRQLLGLRGEWLLEVDVAGQVRRFATSPLEIEDNRGNSYAYREGLEDLAQSLSAMGSPDYSVEVTVDASDSWDELVGNFAVLERARCVVRRWFPGQTIEAARLVLEGELQGFSYGEANEPVSFSVARSIRQQSRQLPTPGMVVDTGTWPVRVGWTDDEKIRGSYYPIIIGSPGRTTGTPAPATEALIVETEGADNTDRLLIAGHEVMATSVTVYDYTDDAAPESATLSVSHVEDGAGRKVAIVEPGIAFTNVVAPGRVYYVGWSTGNPGLRNPRTGEALRGAADVIEWLLRTWTDVVVDAARFAGVRARLNQYAIDTYLNAPTDPLEWMNSEILPLLPVEPRQGEHGLYFYVRPTDPTHRDAVMRLDADTGQIQRVSEIQVAADELVNEVTIEFRPDRATGAFRSRITISAEDGQRIDPLGGTLTGDTRVRGSYRARLSQARFGQLPVVIQAHAVSESATAVRIGQDIIARQSLPSRFVDYEGGTELESLDDGQVIIVNDSRVGISDELALVLDATIDGPRVVLSLELLDDPVLLRRTV